MHIYLANSMLDDAATLPPDQDWGKSGHFLPWHRACLAHCKIAKKKCLTSSNSNGYINFIKWNIGHAISVLVGILAGRIIRCGTDLRQQNNHAAAWLLG